MKKYLATYCLSFTQPPHNHGLVDIDENNYVNGETPVEDYGMFFYRDEPFPENKDELHEIFMRLMDDSAYGLNSEYDGHTIDWWIENKPRELWRAASYYCAIEINNEATIKLSQKLFGKVA